MIYPIGPYTPPEKLDLGTVKSSAEELVAFPEE
jgi:hypothetical protein